MDPSEQNDNFDALKLTIASIDDILKWSNGEVTKSETINYRTQKPERDGLFCEKIFGPAKDINRNDAKFKGMRYRDVAVDRKGEIVTRSIARRERMGHINLAAPVTHIWFLRGTPSPLSQVIGMTVKNLEKVIYFASYIITGVEKDKRDELLSGIADELEAAKEAITKRHEAEAEKEGADVKAIIEARNKELEETVADYDERKLALEKLQLHGLISEHDYRNLPEGYADLVTVGMGAKAIFDILSTMDVDSKIAELEKEVEESSGQNKKKAAKRLKMFGGLKASGADLVSMVMNVVPVIPPDLRPMVQLAGGRFATSDLNDLYRRVINRNNRLKKLVDLNAPEIIKRNEQRMLQEAVDALIDNNASRNNRSATNVTGRRKLKSLADMLKGKQGRFRQNLLGKRVDYSARSVIVSGPELDIDECGMPKMMALELFKPFVIGELIAQDRAYNIKSAQRMIEESSHFVWDALEKVIEGKYVLMNRAPTLHRLGIQAFKVRLIEGKALQLHPLVCKGFNADFDGDQMAVHLPLSDAAQAEAREIMAASRNLLKPADGSPILYVEQDIILGSYFMTMDPIRDQGKAFSSINEVLLAQDADAIHLLEKISVLMDGHMVETTLGRMLFNEILPEGHAYQNIAFDKKKLKSLMSDIYRTYGPEITATVANDIKNIAFKYATLSGLSTSIADYNKLEGMETIIEASEEKAKAVAQQYEDGLISDEERYRATVKVWRENDDEILKALEKQFESDTTTTAVTVKSGARGNINNVKQIGGSYGVTADVTGREIELPIRSNYRDGFTPLESFVSTKGTRKGMISTALRTADSGYLTRRLVDVAQDVFTIEVEGEEDPGFAIRRADSEDIGYNYADRLAGRYLARDVKVDGSVLATKDTLIDPVLANQIAETGIEEVYIRSVLSSSNTFGVSPMSYGVDLSTGETVEANTPVGVIAAQSIGEPGTQLTLNVFHAGGVADEDINQGLPRVDELLEARNPKGEAITAAAGGEVSVVNDGRLTKIVINSSDSLIEEHSLDGYTAKVKTNGKVKKGDVIAEGTDDEKQIVIAGIEGKAKVTKDKITIEFSREAEHVHEIPKGKQVMVDDGETVEKGDRLTTGSLNLKELMENKGVEATQRYIMDEILRIYISQGEDIDDKHLELIVKQMFSRIQVVEAGDSDFVAGHVTSVHTIEQANAALEAEGKEPATYNQLVLGITKVSITSDSWLSAASFQNTNRVLINAAVNGQVDFLSGLKENVIIGGKIPVGTGARQQFDGLTNSGESD